MEIKIIYEDKDLLVIQKPPAVPCQRDPSGDQDIVSLLSRDYLGLVHRLDRPVGGVMVYAKTKQANSFLSKGLACGGFHKEYLTIVSGKPKKDMAEIEDYLKKESGKSISRVADKDTSGAKLAILEYSVLDSVSLENGEILSLLKVILKTGRHHQIRVQLSNYGIPIWGDTKYNPSFSNTKVWVQIALWAYSLKFRLVSGRKKTFFSYPQNEYPWALFADAIGKLKK